MEPTRVATVAARLRRRPVGIVAVEPGVDVVEVNLFAPEHAGESLPLNATFVFAGLRGMNRIVELVGFGSSLSDNLIHLSERRFQNSIRQAKLDNDRATSRNIACRIMKARLCTYLFRVHALLTIDYLGVECVFDVGRRTRRAIESLGVGLVIGKEQIGSPGADGFEIEPGNFVACHLVTQPAPIGPSVTA